jgi:predicted Rdx family selenoprotein
MDIVDGKLCAVILSAAWESRNLLPTLGTKLQGNIK